MTSKCMECGNETGHWGDCSQINPYAVDHELCRAFLRNHVYEVTTGGAMDNRITIRESEMAGAIRHAAQKVAPPY